MVYVFIEVPSIVYHRLTPSDASVIYPNCSTRRFRFVPSSKRSLPIVESVKGLCENVPVVSLIVKNLPARLVVVGSKINPGFVVVLACMNSTLVLIWTAAIA